MELKERMTVSEMTQHLREHTMITPSRVSIGKYAKALGFTPYKHVEKGELIMYYVRGQLNRLDNLFIKHHLGLGYVLSPVEERVFIHLLRLDDLKKTGRFMDLTKDGYVTLTGLGRYQFEQAIRRMHALGLIEIKKKLLLGLVAYEVNRKAYDKLLRILTASCDIERIKEFFDAKFGKSKRTIDSITQEELSSLR